MTFHSPRSGLSFSVFLLSGALAASGCGNSTTIDSDTGHSDVDAASSDTGPQIDTGIDAGGSPVDSGFDGGHRVPTDHRPDDTQCSGTAPAGNCTFGGSAGMCAMDSECTSGTNGRCNMSNGGAPLCRCTYDTCQHDTDCPTGQACACHGAAFHPESNECVPGNCRVDSDCGAGGYCSPTVGGCGGLAGYYCHTSTDLCIDDGDCTGGGIRACQYSATSSRWECMDRLLCG